MVEGGVGLGVEGEVVGGGGGGGGDVQRWLCSVSDPFLQQRGSANGKLAIIGALSLLARRNERSYSECGTCRERSSCWRREKSRGAGASEAGRP